MKRGLFILLIALSGLQNLHSQSIHFNHLTTENGLSNNNVFDILQDKSGLLWFATDDGLNRFDGYDFKIFRHEPGNPNSISDNSVWFLLEDKKGNIWMGTKNGWLNQFDPSSEKFKRWKIKTDEVRENAITCIYVDCQEKIWVGTYRKGLYRLDPVSGKIDHWFNKPDDRNSISNNYISSIIEDNLGNLWIATYFGLNKFNPKSSSSFKRFFKINDSNNSITNNIVWFLTQSKGDSNVIWVGTADGLTKLQLNSETFSQVRIPNPEKLQFGTSTATVIEEFIDGKNILWIDSYAGLIRYDINKNNFQRFTLDKNDPQSLTSNEIHRIYKDRSDVLWLATDKGLNHHSLKSTKFNDPFSERIKIVNAYEMQKKNIKAITISPDNSIWFGTDKGLYYTIDSNEGTVVNKYPQSENLNVWSLTFDALENLWIGTYGSGLYKLNAKSGLLQEVKMFSEWVNTQSVNYNKVVFCDNENNIWIGYWGFGLACLNPSTGKYRSWLHDPNNPFSISYEDVWSIHQDKKGRMWVGTDGGGLNLFVDKDGGKFLRWMVEDNIGLSSNSIYSICESKYFQDANKNDVVLWLGTNNGLIKFVVNGSTNQNEFPLKPEIELTHYSTEEGLSDNTIKSIIEDESGNLWIGTSSGITLLNTLENKFTNFSKADGVIGGDINLSSAARNADGVMFLGGTDGLNYFYPSDISLSTFEPTVLITDFQIFNKSVPIDVGSPLKTSLLRTKEITLAYTQNVFSFQFASIDYTSPKSIQYAYKMEGFDDNWVQSGSRRYVTYTNLNPGDYTFKVKATNSDGVWSQKIRELKVIVTPPWWQTSWAIGLYSLVFILGVWGIIGFQTYRNRLKNELRMQEFESHHLREIEKMKSRFFANLSHEFRTPLTLIKGPLEQLISGRIKENLTDYYKMLLRNTEKLQSLIDQLLELSQLESESIPLNKQNCELVSLLRGFTYAFIPLADEKLISLNFNSSVPNLNALVDRDKLEKIINNLLSNAFKFTPSGGKISVDLFLQDHSDFKIAIVKVIDTGVGIPKEYQSKIFNRFFKVEDDLRSNQAGSGIGLALVKELADLHKWEIFVESTENVQTVFTLKIPVEKGMEDPQKQKQISVPLHEIRVGEKYVIKNEVDHAIEIEENITEKEKPVILFVEDSPDVRSYVHDLLKADYHVLLAERALDAIELAFTNTPDLIISDLMMPGMDGYEFCKRIKSDWQTSHIPFILLTARVTDESKIEGLETGADDYLTKPFNFDELSARIKNLIEQRKLLREKFSREIIIHPGSITSNKLDSEFLQKVIIIAEQNLSNENFDTEFLAKEMFVSRRQLHRKLQAILGQGPGEFIRLFRLKRAAQLLLENKLGVTQIALEVGFESPAQFTRAFKKYFNVLPSEFNDRTPFDFEPLA